MRVRVAACGSGATTRRWSSTTRHRDQREKQLDWDSERTSERTGHLGGLSRSQGHTLSVPSARRVQQQNQQQGSLTHKAPRPSSRARLARCCAHSLMGTRSTLLSRLPSSRVRWRVGLLPCPLSTNKTEKKLRANNHTQGQQEQTKFKLQCTGVAFLLSSSVSDACARVGSAEFWAARRPFTSIAAEETRRHSKHHQQGTHADTPQTQPPPANCLHVRHRPGQSAAAP